MNVILSGAIFTEWLPESWVIRVMDLSASDTR